jgi:hypothetical protein
MQEYGWNKVKSVIELSSWSWNLKSVQLVKVGDSYDAFYIEHSDFRH